jgi:U3 small nucleolar ribonucleoprotein protein IMP4
MTLVTTSRKPVPELRTFGKDLAFAIGGRYVPRGKSGLPDLFEHDNAVIIVTKKGRNYQMQVIVNEEVVCASTFSIIAVEKREGVLIRGCRIGNQTVYESLRRYLDVLPSDDRTCLLSFDGPQRRRYRVS